MCSVDYELILKYITVLLSWPVLLLGAFIWFVRLYKEDLRQAIKRIKDVDVAGVKLGLDTLQEAAATIAAVESESAVSTSEEDKRVEELATKLQHGVNFHVGLMAMYPKGERQNKEKFMPYKVGLLARLIVDYAADVKFYGTLTFVRAMDVAIDRYFESREGMIKE